MIILHIITNLTTGGAELMLERLVLHQRGDPRLRHRIISLRTLGEVGPRLRAAGIEVEAMGMTGSVGLAAGFVRLVRRIRAMRPDLVQTWMHHSDLVGGLAARLAGNRRVVWGIRATDIFPGAGVSRSMALVTRACAMLSRLVPRAIVCVAEAARASHARMGYAEEKMVVIPNGYLSPPAAARGAKAAVRRALDLPEEAIIVGSVGRYNAYKDPKTFVRAMGRVADDIPAAAFVMIGRGIDSGNEELAGWIAATGHADRFHLLGSRSDVDRCFAAMDCFCLHSASEGFPNVLAEAMLAGVASVATDVGDACLLGGGLIDVVPPGNPEAIAGAVAAVCRLSAGERAARGEASQRHMQAHYALERVAERYRRLYEAVVAGEEVTGV